MKIKICGICSVTDATLCVRAGADALGFLCGVPTSVRSYIEAPTAAEIIRQLPPYVSGVLVTTLTDIQEIQKLIAKVPASTLQLHGPISTDDVRALQRTNPHLKLVKAIHVVDEGAVDEAKWWENYVDALLLDTKGEGPLGGTGKTHDWRISRRIVQAVRVPVILAGGLSPGNVSEAVREVRPFAVDVNSGVSSRPLEKDPEKVKQFITRARQAEP